MFGFGKKRSDSPVFAVGPYELDMPISSLENVNHLTPDKSGEFQVTFCGEEILSAPKYRTFGTEWEVLLGAVNGVIYKIAICNICSSKDEANRVAMNALNFCIDALGQPNERKTGFFIWDCADGNVILQTQPIEMSFSINVFLTSTRVREFTQL